MTIKDEVQQPEGTVCVGRYSRLSEANDHALVILSMGLPYWMLPEENDYLLFVNESEAVPVQKQIGKFQKENRFWPPAPIHYEKGKRVPWISYVPYVLLLVTFYLLQHYSPYAWEKAGRLSSIEFIEQQQWWRAVTALTLHTDLPHLIGNLGLGCFLAHAVLTTFGSPIGWFAILLSGISGNAINALFHYPAEHYSIGASTAVFGMIGIITGNALRKGLMGRERGRLQSILFPLAVGFFILGWWGTGGARTDVAAHLFGMLSGTGIGILLASIPEKLLAKLNKLVITLSAMILTLSWWKVFH